MNCELMMLSGKVDDWTYLFVDKRPGSEGAGVVDVDLGNR